MATCRALAIGDDEAVVEGHQMEDLAEFKRMRLPFHLHHASQGNKVLSQVWLLHSQIRVKMRGGVAEQGRRHCKLAWICPVTKTMIPPDTEGWQSLDITFTLHAWCKGRDSRQNVSVCMRQYLKVTGAKTETETTGM